MLERIISILFPVFTIAAVGYFVARRERPDMGVANKLTMDVFAPALIFGALAGRDFHVAQYWQLALAMLLLTVACGVAGHVLSRVLKEDPRTLLPTIMFSNSANLGIPLAVLAYGDQALQPAVILFMVSTLLHFTYGSYLLDHKLHLSQLWKVPNVIATLLGLAVSLSGIVVWPPLVMALKLLGDIAIPLMLFSLGVRMTDIRLEGWRVGLIGGLARPAIGGALAGAIAWALGLHGLQAALLIIYGALPPAVMNYLFAERYNQEPDKVASIVLIGNLLAVVVLPVVLAFAL
ncbi:AEC family transporter [Viridibacterium curvum]|uniref:AEC family transporter n=1 Tax=Viridibacterium curvum TaxID=1101404 RepID=A0ABP9QSE9_9RHOO